MKEKAIIIAAIVVGAWLGNRLKMPSGYLTGGLIAGLVAKGFAGGNIPSGNILSTVSQVLVAYVVVSNSDVSVIKKNLNILPLALGYTVLLILFSLGVAFILSKAFHIDLATAIYGTAPGGLSGMALSATDAGAEMPISIMFHLFRVVILLVVTPFLAAFLTR